MSDVVQMILEQWALHRAEGRAKGFDKAMEWEIPPDYATAQANKWQSKNDAWELLAGATLARKAILEFEKGSTNE